MTPARWNRIEQLYHTVLELPPSERAAFLESQCGSDTELKAEVLALLASDEQAESFLDTPPGDLAAGWLAQHRSQPRAGNSTGSHPTVQAPTEFSGQPFIPELEPAAEPPAEPLAAVHRFVWFTVTLAVGTAVVLGWAGLVLAKYGGRQADYGWTQTNRGGVWQVAAVRTEGPAAGKLQAGDRLLALDGDTRYATLGQRYHLLVNPTGGPYTMQVGRGEQSIEFALQAGFGPASRPLWPLWILLGVGGICGGCACLIGCFKPDEPLARLVTVALFLIALTQAQNCFANVAVFLRGADLAVGRLLNLVTWFETALNFHICYRFAASVPPRRWWNGVALLLYGWACALGIFEVWLWVQLTGTGPAEKVGVFFNTLPVHELAERYLGLYQPVGILAILMVILRNYRLAGNPDEHRRIKWLMFSVAVAAIPFLLAQTAFYVGATAWGFGLLHAGGILVLIVPLTLVYLIRTRRLFDLTVVLRQGVKYLLTKNFLRLLLLLPVGGLVWTALAKPHRTVAEILAQNPLYPTLLVATALTLFFQPAFLQWIDQRFFRASYDRERMLVELAEEIQRLDSMPEIARLVNRTIETALHPKRVLVFTRAPHGHDLALGFSSDGGDPAFRLPDTSALLQLVERHPEPLEVRVSWLDRLPTPDRRLLDEMEVKLLLPMLGSDHRLTGLLCLGEKRSEEPYAAIDRRLLAAVAHQIGAAFEIIRLRERVGEAERTKRDMLARLSEQNIRVFRECPVCGRCSDADLDFCPEDRTELKVTFPIERIIEGKYRLERLLGKGGMGAVYLAADLRLGRFVAVKLILNHQLGDTTLMRRFEREARAAARLTHPNIVTVFDFGQISPEIAFLVMERLEGSSLRDLLRTGAPLSTGLTRSWFPQILAGIKAAHAAGVIHRDLKPENILVCGPPDAAGMVKILDFGLAKIQQISPHQTENLTSPGMVMGTFGYMSPEQLLGDEVDQRGDVFSLGVILVEMLTGKRPFSAPTHGGLLQATLYDEFHLATKTTAGQTLNQVIQKALAKERAHRYPSVESFQKELIPALEAWNQDSAAAPPE